MKIAVTAASGNLGSAIIEQLKKDIGQENLVGIARNISKAEHLGVEIRKGNYDQKADFDKALKGIDYLLIVSGMAHPDIRIQQHRNIIEAAKDNNVKKIVYTSIIGLEEDTAFSPVVKSNRQTEEDIKNSGLNWVIGRNGLYIEPDLEYIENYQKEGGIINCAGNGKCGYTSRTELARAYSKLLTEDKFNGGIYNLMGAAISQQELTEAINKAFNTHLEFKNISVEEYESERKKALGDFLGTVIAGIYKGIKDGAYEQSSHFAKILGRAHFSIDEMIEEFKNQ